MNNADFYFKEGETVAFCPISNYFAPKFWEFEKDVSGGKRKRKTKMIMPPDIKISSKIGVPIFDHEGNRLDKFLQVEVGSNLYNNLFDAGRGKMPEYIYILDK